LDWYRNIKLTRRLQETLQYVAEGKTDTGIAVILSIHPMTAKRYRKDLRRIFNAHSTAELITKAVTLGFVNTDKVWENDSMPVMADLEQ
jgi:DNA-binding CsgD family transcriptional regulator